MPMSLPGMDWWFLAVLTKTPTTASATTDEAIDAVRAELLDRFGLGVVRTLDLGQDEPGQRAGEHVHRAPGPRPVVPVLHQLLAGQGRQRLACGQAARM